MIYGFYLVMVMMLPNGDVQSEVLDHFTSAEECIMEGNWEE